ncbi:MAG TPA: hypothetical protein VGB77_03645 [Abditibacteriaceae bacterium]|jgi:hypothetical protein
MIKSKKGRLVLGVALGAALVSAPVLTGTAKADHHEGGAAMAGGTTSNQPMMVSGKVNNYWTDASGYVTAVDVQTANGPAVIRFAPGMATRSMQMYPVGSTADFWVRGSMEGGQQRWDLAGMGNKQPSSWYPAMNNSASTLMSLPYVAGEATVMSVGGKLKSVVVDDHGTVAGLVIETNWIGKGSIQRTFSGKNEPGEYTWQSTAGGAPMWTLVRVPRETMSAPNPSDDMRRKTPLMLNDDIEATGFVEAPLYGTTSMYGHRFAANSLSVNGVGVGALGFGLHKAKQKPLFGFNLNIPLVTGSSSKELPVVPLGYQVYDPQGVPLSGGNAMMSK